MQFQWFFYLLTSINKNHPNLGKNKLAACPQIHSPGCTWQPVPLVLVAWKMDWKDAPVPMTFRNNCINSKISHTQWWYLQQNNPDASRFATRGSRYKSGRVQGSGCSASEYSCVQNSGLCNHPRCPRGTPIICYDQESFFVPPQTHPETSRIQGPILVQLTEPSRLDSSWFHVSFPPARWGSLDFNIF